MSTTAATVLSVAVTMAVAFIVPVSCWMLIMLIMFLILGSYRARLRVLWTGQQPFVGGPFDGQFRRVPRMKAFGISSIPWPAVYRRIDDCSFEIEDDISFKAGDAILDVNTTTRVYYGTYRGVIIDTAFRWDAAYSQEQFDTVRNYILQWRPRVPAV